MRKLLGECKARVCASLRPFFAPHLSQLYMRTCWLSVSVTRVCVCDAHVFLFADRMGVLTCCSTHSHERVCTSVSPFPPLISAPHPNSPHLPPMRVLAPFLLAASVTCVFMRVGHVCRTVCMARNVLCKQDTSPDNLCFFVECFVGSMFCAVCDCSLTHT
eukprot:GDKI01024612.1.p1 GENE.GDKI01024612.1~~GDKI01024612.1.p1  ORF type:complete len:160 (-),score=28.21 GDKI01024612.1:95-574(-)